MSENKTANGGIQFWISENPIIRHMAELAGTVIYEASNGGIYYVPNMDLPPLSGDRDICLRSMMRSPVDPDTRTVHFVIDDKTVALKLAADSDDVVKIQLLTDGDVVLRCVQENSETIVIFDKSS